MTPYYSDDAVTLYLGDCREVLPMLEPVDLVFTSPPYNMGVSTGCFTKAGTKGARWSGPSLMNGYGAHDDAMPTAEYEAWQRDTLTALWNLLTPDGAIYYNHKPRVQAGVLWTPLSVNPGLTVRQIIIWQRAGGFNFSRSFYVPTHEWIVVFARDGFRLKSKGASGVGDVWAVPQESNTEHPAPFPEALPLMALETTDAASVLDPFAGSGTTLVAAKRLGRRAIGIELNEAYCEIAAKRLSQGALPLEFTA